MKLQNLTVIFIIIILPIILVVSLYINTGIKTIKYQALYDTALLNATHDAIYAFEQNTANNKYSDNAETKRSIIKSSVKMFETSLANAAGISAYSSDEIEEYIPAIVFGMYDGFYLYAPSYNTQTGKYEHDLKNYVYYSETLDDGTIIRYSLDNYVSVTVEKASGEYEIKEGYLIDLDDLGDSIDSDNNGKADDVTTVTYKGLTITKEDIDGDRVPENDEAIKYFKNAYNFSYWFFNEAKIQEKTKGGTRVTYLDISLSNDPENDSSAFVQHKRTIIKEKLESVLNSTITAYSQRAWTQNYKMPKLSEEDWEKIYNNISVTTFFQGKRIGLTKYNGYCVLNSTNSSEYANPNLMYFIADDGDSNTDNYYHDIRCNQCNSASTLTGYRIGSFGSKKVTETDASGNTITKYVYDHDELACYSCINGNTDTSKSVYNYIKDSTTDTNIKQAYWTSLARERYDSAKLTALVTDDEIDISFNINGGTQDLSGFNKIYAYNEEVQFPQATDIQERYGYEFKGWNTDSTATTGISTTGVKAVSDKIYYAIWEQKKYKVKYKVGPDIFHIETVNIGNDTTIISDVPIYPYEGGSEAATFAGKWKYEVGGSWVECCPGQQIQFDTDVTLYAMWNYNWCFIYYWPYDASEGTKQDYSLKSRDVDVKGFDELELTLPSDYYFVGWKDEEGNTYYPGEDKILNIRDHVHLYPIVVKMPELAIVNGSNNVVNFVNDTFTNEETVKFFVDCAEEEKPYIEFFVNGRVDSDGQVTYTTGSGEVKGIELAYYFKIKDKNGNEVARSDEENISITVDRAAPTIGEEITIVKMDGFLGIEDDYKFSIQIEDDSGIQSVQIIRDRWLMGEQIKDMSESGSNQYSYTYSALNKGNRWIVATDILGNSTTVEFEYDESSDSFKKK